MKRALFVFRRDLRLEDNNGLLFALQHAQEVILSFIFTPEQLQDNPYRSDRCVQFMIESLEDLEQQIASKGGKLYLFFGQPEAIVEQCIQTLAVDAVVVNCDYTPYSILRDQRIQETCDKYAVMFHALDDALLHPLEQTLKADGRPYTVFTPYYRNASKLEPKRPQPNPFTRYFSVSIPFAQDRSVYNAVLPKRFVQQKGGRSAALQILATLPSFANYSKQRDFPAEGATTHLSPHLKFTTCSPREIHDALTKQFGVDCELIRSLYWRDFFTSIAFHFPHVFAGAFKSKFDKLAWSQNETLFKRWCEGTTGFPIVDAGMRQLNQTGFMHNRVRMIAGSLLVKDLHIDWRWGERYFAQTLIDYDPAVNNGNWQWVASTGCDAQPYFRIFNPWAQAEKFDPDCAYIKRWVPELAAVPSEIIHKWHLGKNRQAYSTYPAPVVDHAKEAKITLSEYKFGVRQQP